MYVNKQLTKYCGIHVTLSSLFIVFHSDSPERKNQPLHFLRHAIINSAPAVDDLLFLRPPRAHTRSHASLPFFCALMRQRDEKGGRAQ